MAQGRKDIYKDGVATQFPHNDPTKGGRKPALKIREMIESIRDNGNKISIPRDKNVEVTETHVILTLTAREEIAMNLMNKAKEDVNWFKEYAKVLDEYAADKLELLDSRHMVINIGGEDIPID